MPLKIIGLVGEPASGKATFSRLVKKYLDMKRPELSIAHITFSDIMGETLDLWGLPKTRENYQKEIMSKVMTYGDGILTKAVANKVLTCTSDIVVLDGLRWLSDLKMFRDLPNNRLVYITASQEVRWKHARERNEKDGEGDISFEDFCEAEKVATEIYIAQIGATADYRVDNDGSSGKFEFLALEICTDIFK